MSNQLAAAIAEITEAYRGTEHGKVAESIGDAIRQALAAHEAAKPAEPTAFMGVNPRTGTLEFCAHQPSPSVMRDFDMKPLYAAPKESA
jgi:hypothetical protein